MYRTTTLFRPFTSENLKLKNRIVMAPMTRRHCHGGIPHQQVVQYYQRRAEGGVGLIITEGTAIPHETAQGSLGVPDFYGDAALQGWQAVVDAVHQSGACIIPQLWHVGSHRTLTNADNVSVTAHAPSAIKNPVLEDKPFIPQEMNTATIDAVIQAYVTASISAKNLGFDGIELHGAHGYLIDQFFWDYTNKRKDKYGGETLSLRTTFACEIIQAIRQSVGKNFPILFRFSQWKLGAYEAKLAHNSTELENFLIPLVKAGVDIFHCSTRKYYEPEFAGSSLNLAGWTKKLINKPTITVGGIGLDTVFNESMLGAESKITRIANLLERMEQDEFDLAAVGRSLIANPDWPKKIRENEQSIKPFSKALLSELY